MGTRPLPAWARVLADATTAALAQASTLAGGQFGEAEAKGLLWQFAEDLEAAARLLRVIAERHDEQVHG
jgi:hypothetical protein